MKAIHAVDKTHAGTTDSSVIYIPACPLTETNAEYLKRQREAFLEGMLASILLLIHLHRSVVDIVP